MTQPSLFPDYWSKGAAGLDKTRKKYRSIPVPARDLPNQVHGNQQVDDKTRLELMVDYLATRDDFQASPIATPGFNRLTVTEQVAEVERFLQEVKEAPVNKQASAQQSLMSQIGGVAKSIGSKIAEGNSAINKYMDPVFDPLFETAWKVAEIPGQEMGGQFLYNVQKFIPGEQTLERNINLAKQNSTAPSWRKKLGLTEASWVSPTIREHGWGVPAGAHIPLEIIFDPYNLLFGAGFIPDIFRGAKYGGKLVGKNWIDTDFGFAKDVLKGPALKAKIALDRMKRSAVETAQMMAELNVEKRDILREIALFGESTKYADMTKEEKLEVIKKLSLTTIGGASDEGVNLQTNLMAKKAAEMKIEDLKDAGVRIDSVELQDGLNLPEIRGAPARPILRSIATADEVYSPMERSILSMDFFTGLRPNEIENLTIGDLINATIDRGIEGKKIFELSIRIPETGGNIASRRITEEAATFIQEYLYNIRPNIQRADGAKAFAPTHQFDDIVNEDFDTFAFLLPDEAGRFIKKVKTSDINKLFKEGVERYDEAGGTQGAQLLEFYKKNGNFSYVMRLSHANHMFETTPGIRETMMHMGHSSYFHTTRYVASSWFDHATTEEFFKQRGLFGSIVDDITGETESLIERYQKEISDWVDEEIAKGGSLGKDLKKALDKEGVKLSIWDSTPDPILNKKAYTTKGYTKENPQIVFNKIQETRRKLLQQIADNIPDEADDIGFNIPKNASEETVKSARVLRELGTLSQALTDMIMNKEFIKQLPDNLAQKGEKNIATKFQKDLQEWYDPILDVAHARATQIDSDPVMAGQNMTELLMAPLNILGVVRMQDLRMTKAGRYGFGSGGGRQVSTLETLFTPWTIAKRAQAGEKLKKKDQKIYDDWLTWSEVEQDAMKEWAEGGTLPNNWLVRRSTKGLADLAKRELGIDDPDYKKLKELTQGQWIVRQFIKEGEVAGAFADPVSFKRDPNYTFKADNVIRFNVKGEGARDMVVIALDENRWQAFYRSTGKSSGMKDRWLPFNGLQKEEKMMRPIGWIDKSEFLLDDITPGVKNPLNRFGTQEMLDMSNKLGDMNIPAGRILEGTDFADFASVDGVLSDAAKAGQRAGAEKINQWLNTDAAIKRNVWNAEMGVWVDNVDITDFRPSLGEVVKARIVKLADQYEVMNKESGVTEIVLAQPDPNKLQEITIDWADFSKWNQLRSRPVPESLIRAINPPGQRTLDIKTLTGMAYHLRVPVHEDRSFSISELQKYFTAPGKPKMGKGRLKNAQNAKGRKILEPTQSGRRYRFSNEFIKSFRDFMAEHGKDDYGDMVEAVTKAGDSGYVPPSRPGNSTPAMGWSDNNWRRVIIKDEGGVEHYLHEIIRVPRGLDQPGIQFTGDNYGLRWLKKAVNHSPTQKYMRMIVPGTWGAVDAAKLRWKYMFAKNEGKLIASEVGHILGDFQSIFGMSNDGQLHKLKVKGKFNRATGRATDGVDDLTLYERGADGKADYLKPLEGQVSYHEANRGMEAMMEGFRISGQTHLWNPSKILKIRRGWTHEKNLKDASTFLRTPRADLHKYYDFSDLTDQVTWMGERMSRGEAQQHMWDWYHQIDPQLWEMMKDSGFDPSLAAGLAKGQKLRQEHVPYLMTNQANGVQLNMRQFGDLPSQFKEKDYEWQILGKLARGEFEGKIKHEIYNANPIISMQKQVEAYYEYVATERFLDEYIKLGIPVAEKTAIIELGQELISYRKKSDLAGRLAASIDPQLGEIPKISAAKVAHANRRYGANWKTRPISELNDQLSRYQEMSAAWNNLKLKSGHEYVVQSHKMAGTALPADASRELIALGADELNTANAFLTMASTWSNMMRIMATGADLGVMMLHGFGSLGTAVNPTGLLIDVANPFAKVVGVDLTKTKYIRELHVPLKQRTAWAKGAYKMTLGMVRPSIRREWYRQTAITRADMQKHGVAFFRSTFIEDLPIPGVFTAEQRRGKLTRPGEALASYAMRPMEGFGFFLDVSKTEMWKAQKEVVEFVAKGNEAKATELFSDFAASLNAIHGTLEPAIAGITSKQRVFESAFLMYAALYRRSAMALIMNMMSTNEMRRGPALRAVSGMLMAGGMIGAAIKMSGNNEDVFDIGSSDFMSAHFGDLRIGLGTAYYGLMRVGKSLVEQMQDGDEKGYMPISWTDNALLKWWRSMSSPVTSLGIDVLNGRTYIGDPLRDDEGGWEVTAIGTRTARTLAPFWAESQFHDDTRSTIGGLGEFFGLRVSPISPWGQLQTARDVVLLNETNSDIVSWRNMRQRRNLPVQSKDMPVVLLREMIDRNPELTALEAEVSADAQLRGTKARKEQDLLIKQMQKNNTERTRQLLTHATAFNRGEMSGADLRKLKREIDAETRGKNLGAGAAFPEVVDAWDERRTNRLDNPADTFFYDLLYDEFRNDVTNSEEIHDEAGNFLPGVYRIKEEAFYMREDVPPEARAYIEDRRKNGKDFGPLFAELDRAQDLLSDTYWNLHNDYLTKADAKMYEEYRNLPTQQAKDIFERENMKVRVLNRRMSRIRDRYRRQNKNIDRLLVKFYDYSPIRRNWHEDIMVARSGGSPMVSPVQSPIKRDWADFERHPVDSVISEDELAEAGGPGYIQQAVQGTIAKAQKLT